METPKPINNLKELDELFPTEHTVDQTLAKIHARITLKKPKLMKQTSNVINKKKLNKEILYNLENKNNPKLASEIQDNIDIIISELDFNNHQMAFDRLMKLIQKIEDSL